MFNPEQGRRSPVYPPWLRMSCGDDYPVFQGSHAALRHGRFGYEVRPADGGRPTPVRWPGYTAGSDIRDTTIIDGSWAVAVEPIADPAGEERWRLVWFYPYSTHVHCWHLDADGHRVGCSTPAPEDQLTVFSRHAPQSVCAAVKRILWLRANGAAAEARVLAETADGAYLGVPDFLKEVLDHAEVYGDDLFRDAQAGARDLLAAVFLRSPMLVRHRVGRARLAPLVQALRDSGGAEAPDQEPGGRAAPLEQHAALRGMEFAALSQKAQSGLMRANSLANLRFHHLAPPWECESAHRVAIGFRADAEEPDLRVGLMNIRQPLPTRSNLGAIAALYAIDRHICHPATLHALAEAGRIRPGSRYSVDLQVDDCEADLPHSLAWNVHRNHRFPKAVPDIYFTSDIGYAAFRREVVRRWIPWSEREPKAFWRGSTTGVYFGDDPAVDYPRYRLSLLSARNPDLLDAGISTIVQYPSSAMYHAIERHYESLGILKPYIPQLDFMKHRCLIDIDGNANAWGLIQKLLLGSCVLKVASDYRQWFYGSMRPWEDHIPVKADLSDLLDKIEWCNRHPEEAQRIGENERRLALGIDYETEMKRYADAIIEAARCDG